MNFHAERLGPMLDFPADIAVAHQTKALSRQRCAVPTASRHPAVGFPFARANIAIRLEKAPGKRQKQSNGMRGRVGCVAIRTIRPPDHATAHHGDIHVVESGGGVSHDFQARRSIQKFLVDLQFALVDNGIYGPNPIQSFRPGHSARRILAEYNRPDRFDRANNLVRGAAGDQDFGF
jgi:hypothetical protein